MSVVLTDGFFSVTSPTRVKNGRMKCRLVLAGIVKPEVLAPVFFDTLLENLVSLRPGFPGLGYVVCSQTVITLCRFSTGIRGFDLTPC